MAGQTWLQHWLDVECATVVLDSAIIQTCKLHARYMCKLHCKKRYTSKPTTNYQASTACPYWAPSLQRLTLTHHSIDTTDICSHLVRSTGNAWGIQVWTTHSRCMYAVSREAWSCIQKTYKLPGLSGQDLWTTQHTTQLPLPSTELKLTPAWRMRMRSQHMLEEF